MVTSNRIKFEITFEGNAQCWKDADVCAIDLLGPKSEVSARSVGAKGSGVQAGRLKWCILNKGSTKPFIQPEKFVDQIGLTPEIAKTVSLTARVFESYENFSRLVKGLDGSIQPERWARRYDIPIVAEDHSKLEDGESYLIKVQNVGDRHLRAVFIKLEGQPPQPPTPKEPKVVESKDPNKLMGDSLSPSDPDFFSGWLGMVDTYIQAHQASDVELASLSLSELRGRWDEGVSQMREARQRFNEACRCQVGIEEALAYKQCISGKLINLEAALNRKGVFPSYNGTY